MLAITLIEVGNTESPNIGTITTEFSKGILQEIELLRKAIDALQCHFDATVFSVKIQDGLKFTDVENSPPLDATVTIDGLNGEEEHQIELHQTWIY